MEKDWKGAGEGEEGVGGKDGSGRGTLGRSRGEGWAWQGKVEEGVNL